MISELKILRLLKSIKKRVVRHKTFFSFKKKALPLLLKTTKPYY